MGYSSYIANQCKSDATFCSEVVFAHEMYTRVMYIQYVPGMLQIIHHTYIIVYSFPSLRDKYMPLLLAHYYLLYGTLLIYVVAINIIHTIGFVFPNFNQKCNIT